MSLDRRPSFSMISLLLSAALAIGHAASIRAFARDRQRGTHLGQLERTTRSPI